MIKSFVKNFDTVIFDMDGVITTEQTYWDCAALAVYELLNDSRFFGSKSIDAKKCYEDVKKIRNNIFDGDKTIVSLKNAGVNSNWDLCFVVFAFALLYGGDDFSYIRSRIEETKLDAFGLYDYIANELPRQKGFLKEDCIRTKLLWHTAVDCFNSWLLGDEMFEEIYKHAPASFGKQGLFTGEEPLVPKKSFTRCSPGLKSVG